ncbi:MAG: hypothetical protein GTN40_03420 [Candidatus Aenigmarchaeota archaeon]|nr:hypothetical protein [Candidatus Aenigmarchaeota archaeon]
MEGLKKSWETCNSSHGVEPHTLRFKLGYELEHSSVYSYYCCKNREVMKLRVYPETIIGKVGFTEEAVKLFELGRASDLEVDSEKLISLERKIKRGLAMCRHCKFYESKELNP